MINLNLLNIKLLSGGLLWSQIKSAICDCDFIKVVCQATTGETPRLTDSHSSITPEQVRSDIPILKISEVTPELSNTLDQLPAGGLLLPYTRIKHQPIDDAITESGFYTAYPRLKAHAEYLIRIKSITDNYTKLLTKLEQKYLESYGRIRCLDATQSLDLSQSYGIQYLYLKQSYATQYLYLRQGFRKQLLRLNTIYSSNVKDIIEQIYVHLCQQLRFLIRLRQEDHIESEVINPHIQFVTTRYIIEGVPMLSLADQFTELDLTGVKPDTAPESKADYLTQENLVRLLYSGHAPNFIQEINNFLDDLEYYGHLEMQGKKKASSVSGLIVYILSGQRLLPNRNF